MNKPKKKKTRKISQAKLDKVVKAILTVKPLNK
jgi:hypothetical protein